MIGANIRQFRSSSYVVFVLALVLGFSAQGSHGLRGLDRGGHYDLEYHQPLNYGTLFWRPQETQNVSAKYMLYVVVVLVNEP